MTPSLTHIAGGWSQQRTAIDGAKSGPWAELLYHRCMITGSAKVVVHWKSGARPWKGAWHSGRINKKKTKKKLLQTKKDLQKSQADTSEAYVSAVEEPPAIRARDKSTEKSNQITITDEKGRLSQSEIDRMVQEAEKYKEDDEANKGKVEAKNGLKNYCFTMRNTLQEEKLRDKFEGDDENNIEKAFQQTLDWLDENQLAEKDECEAKQKELEGVVNPIVMKAYQAVGGSGMPKGGMLGGGDGSLPGGGGGSGPTVKEVD